MRKVQYLQSIDNIITKFVAPVVDNTVVDLFKKYLKTSFEKYSKINTIARKEMELKKIYVPVSLRYTEYIKTRRREREKTVTINKFP